MWAVRDTSEAPSGPYPTQSMDNRFSCLDVMPITGLTLMEGAFYAVKERENRMNIHPHVCKLNVLFFMP